MEYEDDVYVDILDESPVDKGKGNVEAGAFDRWDGGSVSGADDDVSFYSRYRNEGGEYGGSKSYTVRSVVEIVEEEFSKGKRHEPEDKGSGLSSRNLREGGSEEEGQFSRRHSKCESGDKAHKRSYRHRNVVDGDSSDEKDEDQKHNIHESRNKERKRNYRRRNVVDGDSSDEKNEEQFTQKLNVNDSGIKERNRNHRPRNVAYGDSSDEEQFSRKHIVHGSEDKEHKKNYRRRRLVDEEYSDDGAAEQQATRKLIVRGSGDKERERIYRRRTVVDDDHSDDEVDEQITGKVIVRESGDKQHSSNSKRRRVVGNDYSDNEFECVVKHSKERNDSGSQDRNSGRTFSRHYSRSRDEKMSEDHVEKRRERSRHRDDSHKRKQGHKQDKHLKLSRTDIVKEIEGDTKEDKYKRRSKGLHHSTRYNSEIDEEDDERETDVLGKERDYDCTKESGRDVKEEKYGRGRDVHHSARYQKEHDDDWELAIPERKRDYVYLEEHGYDSEEDKYNRRLRRIHHSPRCQIERDDDDDDWEREIMKRERCSLERGRGMNGNSFEMKHAKREKDRDFRGRDKESLRATLIERRNEGDPREKGEDFWEESQEINQHVKGRMGGREMSYVRGDLRVQITEAKEKSHRREPKDVEKKRDSAEQQNQSLGVSFERDLEERQQERSLRGLDRERKGESKGIQQHEENKGEGLYMIFSESNVNKWEREPRRNICQKEKIHKVIRKKDLMEQDMTSIEDSQKRKWDREMGVIISERGFCKKDSRKQDMDDHMHIIKEADLVEYNIRSRETSQEIVRDRKTRQIYQKREFVSRGERERERRQHISEGDGVCQPNEKLLKKQDNEKKEECQEKGIYRENRETTRRNFVERDTLKLDKEIREKSLEMEVLQKEKRDFMMGVSRESSRQEPLNTVEEKHHRERGKMSLKKTLYNGNRRDLMIWDVDMEKSKILNKDRSRREVVRKSHEDNLENYYVNKENDRISVEDDSVCMEKCTKTIEGETVTELQEGEKCREQWKERSVEEAEADAVTESERRHKTIFAYQISTEATDRDVYDFFSTAGKVRDVRLVMDPISRHFIGVGYVEFYHSMSIPIAVSLSGKLLHSQPIMVKPPETDDNQVHSTETAVGSDISGLCPGGSNRICVGNLHNSVTEALLRQVFEAFGTIELVVFDSAEAGYSERKCIIQFTRLEDARAALTLNEHLALAGQLIKMSHVSDRDKVQAVSADTNDCNEAEGSDLMSDIGVRNKLQVADADTNIYNEDECNRLVSATGVQNEMQESAAKTIASSEEKGSEMVPNGQLESALQSSEPGGIELNKSSSPINVDFPTLPSEPLEHCVPPPSIQAFMTSLKAVLQVPGAAIPIVDTVGVPSECLLLKNMFDSNMQALDEFEFRVKENVKEHCYKFGKPEDIYIDKNSAGCVYLRFKDTHAAVVAQRALHGRWFAGKMITATYMERRLYDAKFPSIDPTLSQGKPPPAWLPHNFGPSFPVTGQTLAPGPTLGPWLPQTYGSNFPTIQHPLAPGPTSAMWLPNNNPVAFVPQGNIFPDMRPNMW